MEIDQAQLLKDTTSFLESNNIPYMITGAWSVIYYGRPRASHDIDFVVEINKKDVKKTSEAFKTLPSEFLVQTEQIKEAINKKTMFNIIYLPTYLKLDFWLLKDDEFNRSRFDRKKRVKILDQFMYIATAEDTILKKLLWFEESKIEKHLIDAAFVYQIQKKNLNLSYLKKWSAKLKISNYLSKIAKIDMERYI